jgi:hypothetical protein
MTAREQRLLALFIITVLVGASVFAYQKVQTSIRANRAATEKLVKTTESDRKLVTGYAEYTHQADAWLEPKLGQPIAEQEALSRLLGAAQQGASQAGLTLTNPQFRPPEPHGNLSLARVSAQVTGQEQAIYPWLIQFHNPNTLRSIYALTVIPDKKDDTVVKCEVVFAQWYIPKPESEGGSS